MDETPMDEIETWLNCYKKRKKKKEKRKGFTLEA